MKPKLFVLLPVLLLPIAGCDEPPPTSAEQVPIPVVSKPSIPVEAAKPDAQDPLAEILEDRDPFARASALGQLLGSFGPSDVSRVQEVLKNFPVYLGSAEFELLLRVWAENDPQAAFDWAFEFGPPVYRIQAIRRTLETLAREDPSAGILGMRRAMLDTEQVAAVSQLALVRGWFQRDREEVLEYLFTLGAGIPRQRGLYAYALSLAGADGPQAAIDWAEAFPDGDEALKNAVYSQAVSALLWSSPEVAMAFCEKHCGEKHGGGIRLILVRARLKRGDPGGEVVEWVQQTRGDDEDVSHPTWVAYVTWASKDHQAAIAWLGERLKGQPDPWIEDLRAEYARQLAADDPARAMSFAEQVQDDVDRERTMVRIARHWKKVDREAFVAWFESAPLDERSRKFVMESTLPNYLPRVER